MADTKEGARVSQLAGDHEAADDRIMSPLKKGTVEDQRDMYRMGKAQELRVRPQNISRLASANGSAKRNFRFVSIFGFSMILMATWETALGLVVAWHFPSKYKELTQCRTSIIALINGGTAGFIWLYLVAWVGFLCVNT